jgi:hypothetical protein
MYKRIFCLIKMSFKDLIPKRCRLTPYLKAIEVNSFFQEYNSIQLYFVVSSQFTCIMQSS